ncbi:SusD/RagB family nutrient-binding outer membrane lipoprotein [Pedobacter sp. MR2016-24]|uniref:SusD/RagB family nutrient-binding outer membrane lipoprotein n=1 Tax=Pedobacter sp. MR2016-24 TaxID=2994466 RepID=UPI002245188D|nr:SusD/RagB family nutrient-binding outer membrane lipoprotein [Pedobacter sp. MR2016-24]MCX2484772.1 SusD/RagB family nutrient-binding outer membrane lipoprotein [Pedobacter sp. MR2016-24]
MKHIKILMLFIFSQLILAGCTKDFAEKNDDPNAITTITPNLLLPHIIRSSVTAVLNESWGTGSLLVQQTAKYQFVDEDRYIWGNKDGIWNNYYNTMRDVKKLSDLAASSNQPAYKAMALILKSWMFSIVTDTYGDIPYSEATSGLTDNVLKPKYDTQESIYNGILADLTTANTILTGVNASVSGDLIYQGDLAKWRKMANSLRVRYLMRISAKTDVSAKLQEIVANPAVYPLFENNTDDGDYNYYVEAPNQFPNFTNRIGGFDEVRLSKTLGDILQQYQDPRLSIFARPTSSSVTAGNPQYVGMPNSLNPTSALNYNGGSNHISRVGSFYYENSITAAGLLVAKGYIMAFPELQFLLAEARFKNLITTSTTAQGYYEKGIETAFIYLNTQMPAGYLQRTGVQFSQATGLQQIGTQKWISLFYTGMESWFEWRRTGFPVLQAGADSQNGGKIPVRYRYPLNEQSQNADNLRAAVARQGADDINTKVWWAK